MRYQPESEEERAFLEAYRRHDWPRPAVTTDLVAYSLLGGRLHVLLVQRGGFPCKGMWAVPGGFVNVGDSYDDQGEDLEAAAARELLEETGLDVAEITIEQVGAFGSPYRDPRTRIITVAYLALIPPKLALQVRAGDDAAHARWLPLVSLKSLDLAFDHCSILTVARAKLVSRLEHGDVARRLLPSRFATAELRALHREALAEDFDEAHFRKIFHRLVSDGVIKRASQSKPFRYRFATHR